jgi:hypothetical protein
VEDWAKKDMQFETMVESSMAVRTPRGIPARKPTIRGMSAVSLAGLRIG